MLTWPQPSGNAAILAVTVDLASTVSCGKISPVLSRFTELPIHLKKLSIQPGQVDAFLLDLGTSSFQFDFPHRGFSLSRNGPLDMRMDGNRFPDQMTAADVVNTLDVADLEHISSKYGEERKSKEIAHAIIEARYAYGKFTQTHQLANIIQSVFNSDVFRQDKMSRPAHVATKTFQALRIFVNDELNEINNGLHILRHYLKDGGRCAVISFHSLEDRIVKRHFHDIDMGQESNVSLHHHFRNSNLTVDMDTVKDEYLNKQWKPLSRKVLEPSEEECIKNPRSRSAKLRAAIKL
ncbi:putative methyltransferase-like protein 15 [Bulinus truncatus]|nr:putative methyltransferase-like protein 15 [Bulinus truncatus]